MGREYLVIVAAGDESLHSDWSFEGRSFDLWIIYFGDRDDTRTKYAKSCDELFSEKGLKYDILRKVLSRMAESRLASYRNVWLPDDDIRMYFGSWSIDTMFDAVNETGADVFQPAIGNVLMHPKALHHFHSSAWVGSLLIKNALYHTVTKVEIMMHGFGNHLFVPIFLKALREYPALLAGWGLEDVIRENLRSFKNEGLTVVVLDCIPAIHTRAVGRHSKLHAIGVRELEHMLKDFYRQQKVLEVFMDESKVSKPS
jgi:hypothetical protein